MKKTLLKQLAAAALALCLLTALTSAFAQSRWEEIQAAGKIVVATSPDYAPYEFLDKDGKPVGADISLAAYVAGQLGLTLQLEAMDFDTVLAAIATGKADLAVAGMVPKEERKETMDFSDVYFNDGDQCVVILKEKAGELKALTDFEGKLVAAQNGTLQQELVTTQLPGAIMEPIVKIPDAIMMVMTGKVEGLALASVVADQYVANYPELAILESRFEYQSLGVAMALPKDSPELLEKVNAVIKEVVEKGMYVQWMQEATELSASLSQ